MTTLPALLLPAVVVMALAGETNYTWLEKPPGDSIAGRIPTPSGYQRLPAAPNSFGAWLRGLPLHPGQPPVRLYNGSLKWNQDAQFAVVNIDVGKKDLQQCADAVMRLRAEYLFSRGFHDRIQFNFTNGEAAIWSKWAIGFRPKFAGKRVHWQKTAAVSYDYVNFRRYLETVFIYAGTASLSKEMQSVHQPADIQLGDIFIKGGYPGHAVMVVDVAVNRLGQKIFLLAQSYMPAQQFHVLKNPANENNPWYPARATGDLITPEWQFKYKDLKRFSSGPDPVPTATPN